MVDPYIFTYYLLLNSVGCLCSLCQVTRIAACSQLYVLVISLQLPRIVPGKPCGPGNPGGPFDPGCPGGPGGPASPLTTMLRPMVPGKPGGPVKKQFSIRETKVEESMRISFCHSLLQSQKPRALSMQRINVYTRQKSALCDTTPPSPKGQFLQWLVCDTEYKIR